MYKLIVGVRHPPVELWQYPPEDCPEDERGRLVETHFWQGNVDEMHVYWLIPDGRYAIFQQDDSVLEVTVTNGVPKFADEIVYAMSEDELYAEFAKHFYEEFVKHGRVENDDE